MATLDSITPSDKMKGEIRVSRNQPKQDMYVFMLCRTLDEPLFTMKYFKNQAQKERKLVTIAKKKQLETIYRNT